MHVQLPGNVEFTVVEGRVQVVKFRRSRLAFLMSETGHDMLRSIVEDIHEDMMRSLVDAPDVTTPPRASLEERLGACGFDGSTATSGSFQRACVRMLSADLTDADALIILEACLRSPSPDDAVRNLERYLETAGSPSVFLRTMLS
ncbi:MAG TPA: hypothetical protein VFH88_01080, partial [Candidatus Krumholzibacteria bacterium]|nr:hypothetical protein [Candidatus Krumholzibacteria bacterium]